MNSSNSSQIKQCNVTRRPVAAPLQLSVTLQYLTLEIV